MIIECSQCESKVDGVVKGEIEGHDDEYPMPFKTVLVECPVCHNALLGMTELIQTGPDDYEWENLHRVYPEQESLLDLDWGIPEWHLLKRISLYNQSFTNFYLHPFC